MKISRSRWLYTVALLVFFASSSFALNIEFGEKKDDGKQIFWLSNALVKCSVIFEEEKLYAEGSHLEIPLQGYETAIYEIYPVEEAYEPLLAGVTFEVVKESESNYIVKFYDAEKGACLL